MPQRLLCLVDLSPMSPAVLSWARLLAEAYRGWPTQASFLCCYLDPAKAGKGSAVSVCGRAVLAA